MRSTAGRALLGGMDIVLRHRGREVSRADVELIRDLIQSNPAATRRWLSLELCRVWGWVQPNGAARDGVCRAMLLALHRAGHIKLPAPQWTSTKEPWARLRPAPVQVDTTPLETSLSALGPVQLHQVRRTPEEELVNGLVQQYHYLGYVQPVGEHLKYLVTAQGRPIACLCWSSAARHLAPRDQHIGWTPATRKANIRLVAYQTRFLILPWVRVPTWRHTCWGGCRDDCPRTGSVCTHTRSTSRRRSSTPSAIEAHATAPPTGPPLG